MRLAGGEASRDENRNGSPGCPRRTLVSTMHVLRHLPSWQRGSTGFRLKLVCVVLRVLYGLSLL